MFALYKNDHHFKSRRSDRLFHKIGEFLTEHRLDPSPTNYAFVHHLLSNPESPLARTVAELVQVGAKLTLNDIEKLGGGAGESERKAHGLVSRTHNQLERLEEIMRTIRADTAGFGRDLQASADALRDNHDKGVPNTLEGLIRITTAMMENVQQAETRLEKVTREASELRLQLEEARDDARRDPLTGLPNRRAFEDAYREHVAAGGMPWIAICDIDHFKSVNDRFGHVVGDRVLKAIAGTLRTQCDGHLVARFGGEEFAVMMTNVGRKQALMTMERAREAVASKNYRLRENDMPLGALSFSSGVTGTRLGEDLAEVYRRADALLYRAKNEGRNRTVSE
ncbi:diguanylate cyclase [Stakelama pacifica]|uniref:diguanylate cyclase n=1 Tax=Stakelama pacifica TaxID=517720 RepID=A0A4R6FUQ3_9SPHN|nr:diguanylate cyclase [Stakelama pacifica]GGO92429.1 GGDEF domain-containing protein [Stakelama pacifica]